MRAELIRTVRFWCTNNTWIDNANNEINYKSVTIYSPVVTYRTYNDWFLNVSGNTLLQYTSVIDFLDWDTLFDNSKSDFSHIVINSGTNVTFNNLTIKNSP